MHWMLWTDDAGRDQFPAVPCLITPWPTSWPGLYMVTYFDMGSYLPFNTLIIEDMSTITNVSLPKGVHVSWLKVTVHFKSCAILLSRCVFKLSQALIWNNISVIIFQQKVSCSFSRGTLCDRLQRIYGKCEHPQYGLTFWRQVNPSSESENMFSNCTLTSHFSSAANC